MITDTVTDIKNAIIKAHFEKDEAKKVHYLGIINIVQWIINYLHPLHAVAVA